MKVWITLLCFVLGAYAAELKYALEDLTVREDGLLVETKTLKLANGVGQLFYESGKIKSETPFKEGIREGVGKTYYESGKLQSETPFKNDKMEGLKKEYYESGVVQSELFFVNDEAHGMAKMYYPTGKLQGETPFKKNKPDGTAKLFSPKTQLLRTIEFKEGEVVQGFDYDAKGKKKELSKEELIEAIKVF